MEYRNKTDLFLGCLSSEKDKDAQEKLIRQACEELNLLKAEYTLTIPPSPAERNGRNETHVIYKAPVQSGIMLSMSKHYDIPTINATFEINIYYPNFPAPTEQDFAAYDSLSGALYLYYMSGHLLSTLSFMLNSSLITGLPLRDSVSSQFNKEVTESGRGGDYAFVFMNIENMKYYNRRYGAELGDKFLYHYAQTLKSLVEDGEYICHPGGDNFLAAVKSPHLQTFLSTIQEMRLPPMQGIREEDLTVRAWCGVVPGEKYGNITFNARVFMGSTAMTHGKLFLKQHITFFDENIAKRNEWSRQVIGSIEQALHDNEIVAFYQPKIQIATGRIIGLEALARWKHNGQFLPAESFEPLLESNKLSHLLDIYMVDLICRNMREWLDRGLRVPRVSVNISPVTASDKDAAGKIMDAINRHDIPVSLLEIELTERIPQENLSSLIDLANYLHSQGLAISIDNFGSGYSSLKLLERIQVDVIKLDKNFVGGLKSARSLEVLKSFVRLAESLGTTLIAVGVETQEYADMLYERGCLNAQGSLYAMPMPREALELRLASES